MRERHHMPNDIAAALKSSGLRADYNARPGVPAQRLYRLDQPRQDLRNAYQTPRTNAHRASAGRHLHGHGT